MPITDSHVAPSSVKNKSAASVRRRRMHVRGRGPVISRLPRLLHTGARHGVPSPLHLAQSTCYAAIVVGLPGIRHPPIGPNPLRLS